MDLSMDIHIHGNPADLTAAHVKEKKLCVNKGLQEVNDPISSLWPMSIVVRQAISRHNSTFVCKILLFLQCTVQDSLRLCEVLQFQQNVS